MRSNESSARYHDAANHMKDAVLDKIPDNVILRKAQRVLADNRLDPNNFIGEEAGYTRQEVARDLKLVEEMERTFAREDSPERIEAKQQAEVLEAVLTHQIEQQNWAGENTNIIPASRHDDLFHNVDGILEVSRTDQPDTHVGLAIDATFSNDVKEKIKAILRNIDNGIVTDIKYYQSPDTDKKGLRVPTAVIAVGIETVRELAETWVQSYSNDTDPDIVKTGKENLRVHFVQFQILEQITAQLHAFEQYANKRNKPEIAGMYREAYEVFDEIFEQKKQELEDSGERDTLHREIMADIEKINAKL